MRWENIVKRKVTVNDFAKVPIEILDSIPEKAFDEFEECEVCGRFTADVKGTSNVDPERLEYYKSKRTIDVPNTPYSREYVRMCDECYKKIAEEIQQKVKRGELRPLTEVPQSKQYKGKR